jgi:3-oxoadipate enol-lactonase
VAEVTRDGIRIHYDVYGDKQNHDVVVLLAGAGSDSSVWWEQVVALRDSYAVITVDNRGTGRSDCPGYTYYADMLAADVNAVLEAEEVTEAALVGFSLGGLIAQRFINNHPAKVTRLALLNCTLGSGNPDTVFPGRDVVNMFLFSGALTQEDCCRNAIDFNFGPSYRDEHPEQYDYHFAKTMENGRGIRWQIPVMVSDAPLIEDYASVKVPVLALMSHDDRVIPPANGDTISRYLPQARVEYVDGHHASLLLHPQRVTEMLKSFLGSD